MTATTDPNGPDFLIRDLGFTNTTIEFFPLTDRGHEFLSTDPIVSSVVIRRSRAHELIDEAGATGIIWTHKDVPGLQDHLAQPGQDDDFDFDGYDA